MKTADAQQWQLGEIEASMAELDHGRGVGHEKVGQWPASWGRKDELQPPRVPRTMVTPST